MTAPPQASGYETGTAGYRRTLLALGAGGMATFILLYSTQALLPDLVRTFGISAVDSTWSMSLTTAGLAVALLVCGPLSEAIGRTWLMRGSVLCSGLIALACPFVSSYEMLLTLRLLEGVALAGLPAVATAYLREELHPTTHARAAGWYIASTAMGGMAARLVSGGIADVAGWRWALAGSAVIALGCGIVVMISLPASRRFVPRPVRRHDLWSSYGRALSDPGLRSLFGIGLLAIGGFVAVFNTLGFRLAGPPFALGVGASSLVFVVYVFGSASSIVAGALADRFGRRAVGPVGCLVALTGLALTLPGQLWTVVAGVAVLTVGFFAVHGVASGWVPTRAYAAGVGTGQAASLYLFAYYVGASVFGSLAGHAWVSAGWPGVVVLAVGLFTGAGVLALRLRRIPALAGR